MNILFDPSEQICVVSSLFDTAVVPLRAAPEGVWFSINPLRERRRDSNVVAYRNILIEFDSAPLDEQRRFVERIGMPYTSCVFSGKKSYHFIISLETALKSREEYALLVRRIHDVVKLADKSARNPSRFSRYPNTIRPDTGLKQELVELWERVPNAELEGWLTANGAPKNAAQCPNPGQSSPAVQRHGLALIGNLSPSTREFMLRGAAPGGRNNMAFAVACDLTRAGFDRDHIRSIVARHLPIDGEFGQAVDNGIAAERGEEDIRSPIQSSSCSAVKPPFKPCLDVPPPLPTEIKPSVGVRQRIWDRHFKAAF